MKRVLLSCIVVAWAMSAGAVNKALMDSLYADPTRVGGNMHGYEFVPVYDSPAPAGYAPFYVSHYGRHGSRSSWSVKEYDYLHRALTTEQTKGNLTAKGAALLALNEQVIAHHNSMSGRLTPKGQREHTRLAERMYSRFTPVFTDGSKQIRSITSEVQRCIISMCSFTNQLVRLDTALQMHYDVGKQFQRYIDCAGEIDLTAVKRATDSLMATMAYDEEVVYERLFVHPLGAKVLYPADSLQTAIYETAIVAQDFDLPCTIFDYMAPAAVYRHEVRLALLLCARYGNMPGVIERRLPYIQLGINDIINKADEVVRTGAWCADLRFGHDLPLLSIVSAMGISGVGDRLRIEEIEDQWMTWANLCMASNLQLVFYKPQDQPCGSVTEDQVWVKVLYNEQERQVTGVTEVMPGYYRWGDLKQRWKETISDARSVK